MILDHLVPIIFLSVNFFTGKLETHSPIGVVMFIGLTHTKLSAQAVVAVLVISSNISDNTNVKDGSPSMD